MMTETLSLSDFLQARIAEDENLAHAAVSATGDAEWGTHTYRVVASGEFEVAEASVPSAAHIARHDPARVLADCLAKRRIIELRYSWNLQAERMSDPPFGPILETQFNTADAILRTLALPYADHPDYNPAWRL